MSKLDKFKAKNSLALALKLTTQANTHNLQIDLISECIENYIYQKLNMASKTGFNYIKLPINNINSWIINRLGEYWQQNYKPSMFSDGKLTDLQKTNIPIKINNKVYQEKLEYQFDFEILQMLVKGICEKINTQNPDMIIKIDDSFILFIWPCDQDQLIPGRILDVNKFKDNIANN